MRWAWLGLQLIFIWHYEFGKGRTVDISSVGLLGAYKSDSSVQRVMREAELIIQTETRKAI